MNDELEFGLDDITVIIANYGTVDLLRQCYNSFRELYPTVKMIVIDNGSRDESPAYLRELQDANLVTIFNPANYGHGPALHQGIQAAQTRLVFTLDTDTIARREDGFLEQMAALIARGYYAVGYMCHVNQAGFDVKDGEIQYIHPSAALYDLQVYVTLPPFIHHGSPAIENMIEANRRAIPMFEFPIEDYVKHIGKGTVKRAGGWSPSVTLNEPYRPPFMSFVTRCYKRPAALLRCLTSISKQSDADYESVLIIDDVGIGIVKANALYALPENTQRVRGRYVHLIDDDDYICNPEFVATVKTIAAQSNPDVIIVQVCHPNGQVLPSAAVWMRQPVSGKIGGSSVVVRRDVWLKHIDRFGDGKLCCGDFQFIQELFNKKHHYKIYWLPQIMVTAPHKGQGKPE